MTSWSELMHEWRRVSLGEVASEVTVGYVGTMAREYRDDGVPFLRSLNVRPHRIVVEDMKYIDDEFHEKLKKSRLRPGDVVTVRTGKPGQTAVVPDWLVSANCSDLVITRPGPNLDARWLSYYMNWVTESQIAGHLVGAVQQHFNVKSAMSLEFLMPPLAMQQAIAEVLGALDNKIVANSQVIATAESLMIAQAGTSPNRAKVDEIASQWKVALSPDAFESEVALFSLPAFDEGKIPDICSGKSIMSNKTLISKSCVLMSKLNPRIPRIWDVINPYDQMSVASTEFVVLVPNQVRSSLLWASLSDPSVSVGLAAKVAGTSGSHQRVKPAESLALQVKDPRALRPEVQESIADLGAVCHLRRIESSRLKVARDQLIPLLMSGKVRVRDAEKIVEGVV